MKPKPTYNPGDKIGGRFQVHQALMGSMGEVYLCLDLERNYPFALKTFQSRFLTNRKLRNAFNTEVATWVKLEKHPNIVRCFYMDTIDDRPFMFLEWIASDETRGTDLRSWLRRDRLNMRLVLTFALDICQGLIHAGEKQPGIVHRDLKPENILVAQGQVAKITDFGLASIIKDSDLKLAESEEPGQVRQTTVGKGGVVGTPAYMAPEQWRAEEPDVRTDLYAVGCILFEMASGKLPFVAKNLEGYLIQHLNAPIPTITDGKGVPAGLNKIVARCLAKNRSDRFGSVTELLSALTYLYTDTFKESPRELQASGGFTAIDYNYRGVTYDKLDRYEEALADYSRAVKLDAAFVLAYNNRGATYERLRRYQDALDDYNNALEHEPSLAQAHYNRGNVFSKMKDPDKAIEEFTKAINLDAELMRAYISRGSEYYIYGRLKEALEDFSAAIGLDSSYAKAYVNRAITHDSLKDFEKALEDYSKAIQLSPTDPDIYFNRGLTLYSLKRFDQALEDFTKVLDLSPGDTQALYYRGLCFGEQKMLSEAVADHTQAIALDESIPMSFMNLGAILYQRGALKAAAHCFQQAARHGFSGGTKWLNRVQDEIHKPDTGDTRMEPEQ